MVVNFSIKHNDIAPVGGFHGLMASRRQINDCKPAKSEQNILVLPDPRIVGAAQLQSVQRGSERLGCGWEPRRVEETKNSTHSAQLSQGCMAEASLSKLRVTA